MNVFFKYLQSKTKYAVLLLIFGLIFAVIFSLYKLEVEAVLYAIGLCTVFGAVIILVDFTRYYKKHKILVDINNNVNILTDTLPESNNLIEQDYIDIVNHLMNLSNQAITNLKTQRADSIDYYTTWVHQIKTPIAAMRMMLQGSDNSDNNELLDELFRIEQYVEMVLSYFRLDSVSNDFVFGMYNLDNIIKKSIRKYATSFVKKRIGLVYDGTEEIILTDKKWLGFIIEQILSNAIKYADKGNVTISVEGNILCISDTGIGISQEDLPRIFEKGYSGYNGRANSKATGLGLFLCKQASDKLSHKIYAKSQVGEGTSIYIDLSHVDLEVE
ncbi:MAG: HAMP domain-containing histidine kinase [Clostridiales bacterium]|nr:HAMP domain-containing histidine kinase [Clostridiales bacterium]